jgi:hypothetical protein
MALTDDPRLAIGSLRDVEVNVAELLLAIEGTADSEALHWDEDALYRGVLAAIGDGTLAGDEAAAAARLVMRVADVDYARWYA